MPTDACYMIEEIVFRKVAVTIYVSIFLLMILLSTSNKLLNITVKNVKLWTTNMLFVNRGESLCRATHTF